MVACINVAHEILMQLHWCSQDAADVAGYNELRGI